MPTITYQNKRSHRCRFADVALEGGLLEARLVVVHVQDVDAHGAVGLGAHLEQNLNRYSHDPILNDSIMI